jgi:hypothetical protein
VFVTPSSSTVQDLDHVSPTSSSDPPEFPEDTRVVPTTTPPLLVWAQKTLESAGSEIGIPSNTRRTRSDFSLMEKVLATDDPSTYAESKGKPEWENEMDIEYDSLMKNNTWKPCPTSSLVRILLAANGFIKQSSLQKDILKSIRHN